MMGVTLEGIVPTGMVVGGKEKPGDKGLKTDGREEGEETSVNTSLKNMNVKNERERNQKESVTP